MRWFWRQYLRSPNLCRKRAAGAYWPVLELFNFLIELRRRGSSDEIHPTRLPVESLRAEDAPVAAAACCVGSALSSEANRVLETTPADDAGVGAAIDSRRRPSRPRPMDAVKWDALLSSTLEDGTTISESSGTAMTSGNRMMEQSVILVTEELSLFISSAVSEYAGRMIVASRDGEFLYRARGTSRDVSVASDPTPVVSAEGRCGGVLGSSSLRAPTHRTILGADLFSPEGSGFNGFSICSLAVWTGHNRRSRQHSSLESLINNMIQREAVILQCANRSFTDKECDSCVPVQVLMP
jgi:hypothetical protein